MSVRKLFKEYHTEYPDGYQLSSFKRIVSEYRFHIKVVGHVEHYAAEQMYTSNPQLSSSASFLRLNVLSSLN